jgi:hypothetical protein
MLNKVLVPIFIALCVVVVIEVGYLVIYKSHLLPGNLALNKAMVVPSGAPLFRGAVVAFFKPFEGGILKSAVVTANLEGRVVEVINEPGVEAVLQYEKGLLISPLNQPSTPKNTRSVFFRKTDIPVVKVYEKFLVFRKEIKLEELRVGDSVRLSIDIDLMKDPLYNRLKIDIEKL